MKRLAAAAGMMWLVTTMSAQLPAGTRDVNDNSRMEAGNAKLREAESALEKGDYAGAAVTLKALAAERPKDARIQYDLGFAEERADAESDAAAAYAAAIAADPGMAEARVALGLLDARAGRIDKAHAELGAASEQANAAAELRARAYRALAQLDEAAHPSLASEELISAIKLSSETAGDVALGARLAARGGDASAAEVAYRRVLQAKPDDVDAAVGLAGVLAKTKRLSDAEAVLAGAMKTQPNDPRVVSQLASIYAAEGKVKEAIPLLVQMRGDPQVAANGAVTRQLARLYALDGQNAEAEAMYKAALGADPRDPVLLDDLGTVLVREQKYPEAEAVLTQAVTLRELFPTREAFGDAAGHAAFAASKNGHPKDALQLLKLRATVQPNSGPSLFLEATAYDSLHEYKEAERAYRAFLAIAAGQFPDQEFQARHRLVALEHMK